MNKILLLSFGVIFTLFICGCSDKRETPDFSIIKEAVEYTERPAASSVSEAKTEISTESSEETESQYNRELEEVRRYILEQDPNAVAAAAFIGYIPDDYKDLWDEIETEGYDVFAEEIPENMIFSTAKGEGEVWCVIPAEWDSSVSLRKISVDAKPAKEIFSGKNGEPFLVICSRDSEPEVEIVVENSHESVTIYPEEESIKNLENVYDLTIRPEDTTNAEMPEGLDIKTMVLDYYERNYYYRPQYAEVYENRDGSSTVRLYDDNTAASAWYEVYENSSCGRDMLLNEEINFLE